MFLMTGDRYTWGQLNVLISSSVVKSTECTAPNWGVPVEMHGFYALNVGYWITFLSTQRRPQQNIRKVA